LTEEMAKTKMMRIIPILIVISIMASCAHIVTKSRLSFGSEETKWAAKTMKKMTLEEKIGQMVAWQYSGNFVNRDSDYIKELESLVIIHKIGGLILFGGNVYETSHLTNYLQSKSQIPLLIASDFERGAGNQITGATLFPPLMAIGAANSEDIAYKMGKITAIEGRAMGIHMTYAPVVDVNINPDNPIINTRSIGEDPEQVSRLTIAFIRGCQENGLIATAKHFPGHGDTDLDSHSLLPTINADRSRLNKVELYPFKRAIDAGVQAIMTAHLHVPALDATPNLPATLSPLILTELLRKELGFKGLIVTDAMTMAGITNSYTPQEAGLKAILAGADMLLLSPEPANVINFLIQAARLGQISEARINESVKRILEAKARLGLNQNKLVNIDSLPLKVAPKPHLEQAILTFESAATLVKNEGDVLPLANSDKKIAIFSLSSDPGDYYAGRAFCEAVKKRCPEAMNFYADADAGQENLDEAAAKALGAEVFVFALFSSLRAGKGSVDLEPKHIQLVKKFAEGPAPVVVISFGSPYFLRHFPEADSYLCLYRNTPQTQEIAAKALLGEIDLKGKLPVSLPGLYPLGHGIQLLKKADVHK
jgi:beta-N-acetylhexosaminidase